MTASILPFDVSFDATDMTPGQILTKVREKGWKDFYLDAGEFSKSDKLTARRLSERHVYGD